MSYRRDPVRLDALSASESDVELARALEALARDRPTQEELQRVRRRLEATLTQQTSARSHTTMLKPAAGLVVLIAAIMSVRVWHRNSSYADNPVVYDRAEATEALPAASPAKVEAKAMSDAAQRSEPTLPLRAAPTLNAKHVQPLRVEKRSPPSAPAQPVHATAPVSSAVQRGIETTEQRTSLATPSREPHHEQITEPARPARVELDEVTLIQQARQLARDDQRAALRALDQHRRNFPHGMLSQEREVLEIELLRALSRTAEADKRLEAFRRDFPRSIYLQRLGAPGHRD